MATFEEQCELVSERFKDSRERDSADPRLVKLFDRLDLSGPLAVMLLAGDIKVESNRPANFIAEAYVELVKLDRSNEGSVPHPVEVVDSSLETKVASNDRSALFKAKGVTNGKDLPEVYDNQFDQAQIDEVKEIIEIYDTAKIEEALKRAKDHLAKLRTLEKVEIHSAYNLVYHFSQDEFMAPEVKSFCRDVFEFLSDFVHPVGASATNSYVFSYLLHEEKFDLAEDLLRRAVSWNFGFESLNALSNLGQILFRKRDFFKAEAIFTYVRMSNVSHMRPEANYWLGRIYTETARPEQAALVLKEVSQVNGDSYQELATGCLGGEIPKTDWIGESAVAQLIPNPIAPNRRIPESLPNLELAKDLLINHFPGLKYDSPLRVRYNDEIVDGIGNVARFLDVLSANDFSLSDSENNHWSELLDFYQHYDALDEHLVRYSVEIAQRSMNLGCWQDAGIYARSHFILGNLDLCLAAWLVNFKLEEQLGNSTGMSLYPVFAFYAHFSRLGKGHLAKELADVAGMQDFRLVKFLNSCITERNGSLAQALSEVSNYSSSDFGMTELAKAVVLIRDQDWKTVKNYLWTLDSKRLENGDQSNTGLESEMLRLNCMLGTCEHALAPSREWVSGIDLFSCALVDAYYSRWDSFCLNLEQAMNISGEHATHGSIMFKKIAEEASSNTLRHLAANDQTPKVIFEMICDLGAIEHLTIMTKNESAKEVVAKHNPGIYSVITGTASLDDLKLALNTKNIELAEIIADYENLDADLISGLAGYNSDQILKKLLLNKSCTVDVALSLIGKISNDACWELASNTSTDSSIIEYLAKHEAEYVRRAVAGNANTSDSAFEVLAGDSSWTVREAVKNNENAPETARAIALLME